MKKQLYVSPKTEVLSFQVEAIICQSPQSGAFGDEGGGMGEGGSL